MIESYTKNEHTLQYKLVFKPIKHVYFRKQADYIMISANKNMSKKQVLTILDLNFEKLLTYHNKQKRTKTDTYQLWGEVIDASLFFKDRIKNQKNYEAILIEETYKQVKVFEERLKNDLKLLNLTLKPTKVKVLKSKFGSCQIIKKEITINAFLAKLDPVYLYYVLLHEYCHLLVPNHSSAFYKLLDQLMPMHKSVQKALRKYVITF